MTTKQLVLCLGVCVSLVHPLIASSNLLESFTITMQNVEVRQLTESSLQFSSDSNSYFIKLEPNKEGKVIFSLWGIGYATTARVSNLLFGVRVTGYHKDRMIQPVFGIDDFNKEVKIEQNRIVFHRINGLIPVMFNEEVDSINLQFSNSMDLNVNQYLGIQDLQILTPVDIPENPEITPCMEMSVMIAIEGTTSIEKKDRTTLAKKLLDFVRNSGFTQDSNSLCIMEYGTDIRSMVESTEERELVSALQKYKRGKNCKSKFTSWSNWSVAFDEAIRERPEVFIFITDGWSNWCGQEPATFSGQYKSLLGKCNTLKENGTRLLFVTTDLDEQDNSKQILYSFLNNDQTRVLQDEDLTGNARFNDVDLITAKDLATGGASKLHFVLMTSNFF